MSLAEEVGVNRTLDDFDSVVDGVGLIDGDNLVDTIVLLKNPDVVSIELVTLVGTDADRELELGLIGVILLFSSDVVEIERITSCEVEISG